MTERHRNEYMCRHRKRLEYERIWNELFPDDRQDLGRFAHESETGMGRLAAMKSDKIFKFDMRSFL